MLVLKRYVGENIHILTPHGQTIVVAVSEVRGNYARIGIEAPRDCKIVREELLKRQKARDTE